MKISSHIAAPRRRVRERTYPGSVSGNDSTTTPKALTIDGTTITRYNKNGITVSGPVAATITNNVVTGAGPLGLGFAAQNGIQVSYGASARLVNNTVTLNNYTPPKVTACGLLLYKAGGVSGATKSGISYAKADNQITNNETDICNFGKGGGFSPTP
jgi:Right handed beta helix region